MVAAGNNNETTGIVLPEGYGFAFMPPNSNTTDVMSYNQMMWMTFFFKDDEKFAYNLNDNYNFVFDSIKNSYNEKLYEHLVNSISNTSMCFLVSFIRLFFTTKLS